MSACCSLAEKLGGRRLADLDAELRTHAHRSFRKLAEAFGVPGQKSAVERHKHRCLRVGEPFDVPEVKDPPVRGPVQTVPEVSQGQRPEAGIPAESVSRGRAPETVTPAKTLLERTAYVVSQMAAGTWDSPRDIPRCAETWGLHPQSVRDEVRVIFAARRLDRGDVEQREEESLAFYAWQLEDLRAVLTDCTDPEEKAKVHARITEVRGRMDLVGGLGGKATVNNFNFGTDQRFIDAARRYVDTVQDVLASAAAIAARLGAVDPDVVAAVLAEAEALLDERLAPPKPTLLTQGTESP